MQSFEHVHTANPVAALRDRAGRSLDLAPIRPLLDRIERRFHPEAVWLFGSRARGDARPGSDWDLAVLVADTTSDADFDPMELWRLKRDVHDVYADVVLFHASEFRESAAIVNTLAYSVATEGVRLDAG